MQDDRKKHWDSVYRDKSPLQVSWYQVAPTLSYALIQASDVDRDAPLIDIGGGASTLVDRLLDGGYSAISILDISAQAMEHARQRLGERARHVRWIEADITRFETTQTYNLWHDRAVFHFLTEADDRARYRAALERMLVPGGQLIIGTFAPGGPESCSGLSVMHYDTGRMQAEFGAAFELLEMRTETHHTPSGNDQLFNFFHWLRRNSA